MAILSKLVSRGASKQPFAPAKDAQRHRATDTDGAIGGTRIDLDYPVFPRSRAWSGTPGVNALQRMVEAERSTYFDWLDRFATLRGSYAALSAEPSDDVSPCLYNRWFSSLDALVLYGLLAVRNPANYIEIGSGESTKIARRAIADHSLRTRIVSIDPQPRSNIDALSDAIIRSPFEEALQPFLDAVHPGDIVMMDGSHRSFQNSDVTVFFVEAFPGLPEDVVYGLHDIFLLGDYPPTWTDRYYNEQYMLAVYLLGGAAGDRIALPLKYISEDPDLHASAQRTIANTVHDGTRLDGSTFWLHRDRPVPGGGDYL